MRGREGVGEGSGGRRRGGGGEEEMEEGEKNWERKGRREKEEFMHVLRGEDGDKGVGMGEGFEAYPLSTPHVF